MGSRVGYTLDGPVATITMDDGKVNALSRSMLGEVDAAFDRAEDDGAVVVLAGRDGMFSAGFDLKVLTGGGAGGDRGVEAGLMLQAGFALAHRMLSFPRPIVVACTGHAIAMGAFLVLSGDYRIGVAGGRHRIAANEVAIGLTMPRAAVEILRQRLAPSHFQLAVNLAEVYAPDEAVAAGFLDRVVPADDLLKVAAEKAVALAALDLGAHAASKLRAREALLTDLRAAMRADDVDFGVAS